MPAQTMVVVAMERIDFRHQFQGHSPEIKSRSWDRLARLVGSWRSYVRSQRIRSGSSLFKDVAASRAKLLTRGG